ncbi:HEAT repeat domain-containing protein [Streptomyces sp. NPDC053427]|uniref:HEAT repeat domain-containing protein n=1 Tax=Streptomyces sp. NPDC053427 TaxID=3365701 RepID=UPI0037CD3A25
MFTTIFLLEFTSWYWHDAFDDPELRDAYDAMKPPTTAAEFHRGFLTLLRSDDTVARAIALDFYDRAEMTERHVGGNALEEYEEEVFAVARQLLREPPTPKDDGEHSFAGANHASALGALLRFGLEDEDAPTVAAVLERMPDEALRWNALNAAHAILEDQETPDPRLAALAARVERCGERMEAVAALRDTPGAEATEALVRATGDEEWQVRQEAAAALASGPRFYAHRTLVARLAEQWSADERSTAADTVRDALADGPHSTYWEGCEPEGAELRAAHRELRSPTGETSHRRAFRTLLHSGQPVAVGIALDHFHDSDGLVRFGLDDGEHLSEVLAVARGVLAEAPSEAGLSPGTGAGANHASALGILAEVGEPADAAAIVAALRTHDASAAVREAAVGAAADGLARWESPDERVVAALERLIFDGSADMDLRTDALNALFGLEASPQAAAVLVRATRSAELPLQLEGAVGLTYRHLIEEHRDLLRNLSAAWPQDAGDRAALVRSRVSE